jgi:FkbM family methyltransferase
MSIFSSLRPYARRVGYFACYWRTAVRQFNKRVLRRDLDITLPTGLRLNLPKESHYASVIWVTQALADDGCEQLLLRALRPEAEMIDVGAHLGYYSLWCSPRVRRVHAFEPDPRNLEWLDTNARRTLNVTIIRSAVSDFTGTVALTQHASSAQTHVTALHEAGGQIGPQLTVPCTRLDDYWEALGRPAVCALKVDVEGHEVAVFRGAVELMKTCQPVWLVEISRHNYREAEPLLTKFGYAVLAAVPNPTGVALRPIEEILETEVEFSMAFIVPARDAAAWVERGAESPSL